MPLFLMLISLATPLFCAAQSAPPTDASSELQQTKERLSALEDRLSKLEAPGKAQLSAFNPGVGMALDSAFNVSNGKAGFQFRAAELNVEAAVDPFLKGWAVITASNGTPAVDAEEAAVQTTSLPYNLTVTGGRVFASFGRLAHFHDHELPVVNRPPSLDTFIGGETRADGFEVNYLFPTDHYINAVFGMYDKMGTNNARVDPSGSRSLNEFTYLGRLSSFFELGENFTADLGADSAWTPKRTVSDTAGLGVNTVKNTWRTLNGVDLAVRYTPVQGGLYRGFLWGTEALQNNERRFNPATMLPTDRVRAYSGFSYFELKAGRRWRPGVLVDLTEDQDRARQLTKTFIGYVTCDITEFQRLRLQYARAVNNVPGMPGSHTVSLQWTAVFGRHVHGFRDR